MSDDIALQLPSNSRPSNPSLPTKLAKLEARMAGRSTSSLTVQTARPPAPPPPTRFPEQEELLDSSSDDDNAGKFLIRHNIQKRQKLQEDFDDIDFEKSEEITKGRLKPLENVEIRRNLDDPNKKKQGRGRGRPSAGRGCGSKAVDQMHSVSTPSKCSSNGQLENPSSKENWSKMPLGNDEIVALQEEISVLRVKVATLEEELNKSRQEASDYLCLSQELEKELKELKEHGQQMETKLIKVLSDLLIAVSKAERQNSRMKIQQESLRLGNIGVIRTGTIISEAWEDGQALKDVNSHLRSLLETKESIERYRKLLKKRQSDKGDGSDMETSMSDEDFQIQEEICKSRLASIKREEETYLKMKDRYELEKARLICEMKRIRDEDDSRFNNFPILNKRYAFLNLLGKGGFSEVYKAFDLVEHRYVACKVHSLNHQWREERKQSYICHVVREYNIHKTLVHPHIVRLWDVFEIDHNRKDLDAVLKGTPTLPEREARVIMVQIFHGLIYLNKGPLRIIHYDLKPGNVLFDEVGVAKVTDFGLSKIVEDDAGSQGMELTSQGAGTYWYLPPECFEINKTPLISSKVDVWSAGVIFYQMLYGRRPFGHDQTQEKILREDTIINARKVEFPSKPYVSSEAKELIRRCLTYNQAARPDVLTIAQDPYLSYSKR
ncbi:serine threonine-protein kinase [Musa troglodytarum]|uniref:Serine threonine-protein kinase n=1 Tax=Musa troglodytarum TaxID=320322 RepID=A0A9E7EEG9_9LILI|nr:serine threonine-protein kinase [Musa troglodytarum]